MSEEKVQPRYLPNHAYWDGQQQKYIEPEDPTWNYGDFALAILGVMKDFGWALGRLRNGRKVCRKGWNGKGMWIVLQEGYPDGIPINANTARATGMLEGTTCKFLPYIMMRTVDGSFVPWLASQTDVLAEDWQLVE